MSSEKKKVGKAPDSTHTQTGHAEKNKYAESALEYGASLVSKRQLRCLWRSMQNRHLNTRPVHPEVAPRQAASLIRDPQMA